MSDRISFSNPNIERAIWDYKFVALIEVTNGITKPQKRQEKKKQIKRGRKIIELAFGEEVQVSGGLALIKNTQKDIRELDFLIEIPGYHLGFLCQVVDQLLATNYLDPTDRFFLQKLSDQPRTLVERLNPASYRRDEFGKEYLDRLSHIKGAVLEHYVAGLLKHIFKQDYTISIGTEVVNLESPKTQRVCTDILLACPPGLFKESLDELTQVYSGRQKIKVNFPEKIKPEHKERNIRPPYSHCLPF